jgi:hypothetical protein
METKQPRGLTRAWALSLILLTPCRAGAGAHLPFINDNYSKAVEQAKQRKLPIFVEVWAPW